MNAVRMSHYPPDPAFLEAADELGLYVLDELAGWQGFYDTPTGARLIGQMVRRDVNHPSILFWDNGNEGGWNTDNDGEFARWDPQRRPVLHPWAIHGGINTDHYENYDSTVKLERRARDLHADGIPARSLRRRHRRGTARLLGCDGQEPDGGGRLLLGLRRRRRRAHRSRRPHRQRGQLPRPMASLGPHHEKEGSYFAVKEIWSPVRAAAISGSRTAGSSMRLENRYDFTRSRTLHVAAGARCACRAPGERVAGDCWPRVSAPLPPWHRARAALGTGRPAQAARGRTRSSRSRSTDPAGARVCGPGCCGRRPRVRSRHGNCRTPMRTARQRRSKPAVPAGIRSAHRRGWQRSREPRPRHSAAAARAWWRMLREPKQRTFKPAAPRARAAQAHAGAGAIHRECWRVPNTTARCARSPGSIRDDELVLRYVIDYRGTADHARAHLRLPEASVAGKRWVGAGPYRIWKNRQAGTSASGCTRRSTRAPFPARPTPTRSSRASSANGDWLEMRTARRRCRSAQPERRAVLRPVHAARRRETRPRAAGARLVLPARRSRPSAPSSRCPTCWARESQPSEFRIEIRAAKSLSPSAR